MKRGIFWVVALVLCFTAVAAAQAVQLNAMEMKDTPIDLPQEMARAFSGEEWKGYAPVFWRAFGQMNEGGIVVMQRAEHNVLCILGRGGGAWQVTARSDTMLRDGSTGDYHLEIGGASMDAFWITFDDKPDADWDEGYAVKRDENGEWQVTDYYFCDDLGTRYFMYLEPDNIRMLSMDVQDNIQHARVTGGIELSFERFDRAEAQPVICEAIRARNDPPDIPQSGAKDALPQPQAPAFEKGKTYSVYTGPGEHYARAGMSGEGVVSTDGWIQVFGREGDWLLIQYNADDQSNCFGYITAAALPEGANVEPLSFDAREAVIQQGYYSPTDDPLRNELGGIAIYGVHNVHWLATLGNRWVYVEVNNEPAGRPMRGFVRSDMVVLRSSYQGYAVVYRKGSQGKAPVYQAADALEKIGSYYNGVLVKVLSAQGDWSYVRIGDEHGGLEGYISREDLLYDAAPIDILHDIPQAQVRKVEDERALCVRARPDESAEPVWYAYAEEQLTVLGEVDGYVHVQRKYGEGTGFLPAQLIFSISEEPL